MGSKVLPLSTIAVLSFLISVAEAFEVSDVSNPFLELKPEISWEDLSLDSIQKMGIDKKPYLEPNELVPARMLTVTRNSAQGAYVGVGTDRCLMAAALNPQIQWLIMTDYDPRVVRYNQINLALIRASKNRISYLKLRLSATHADWISSAMTEKIPTSQDVALLSDPVAFQWWQDNIREHRGGNMASFQSKLPQKFSFMGANPLYDDILFERVQKLACEGKIQISWTNLVRTTDVRRIVTALVTRDIPLSIVDISNAWFPTYLGYERLSSLISEFSSAATEKTLLMGTAVALITVEALGPMRRYTYFTAHLKNLHLEPNWTLFLNTLSKWFPQTRGPQDPLASEVEQIDPHLTCKRLIRNP